MTRTKLCDRILPDYTRGEEIFNMVSHIVGAAFGVVALTLCVVFSALKSDAWAVVSSAIYGVSLILLYTMSSVYHGLPLLVADCQKSHADHGSLHHLRADLRQLYARTALLHPSGFAGLGLGAVRRGVRAVYALHRADRH